MMAKEFYSDQEAGNEETTLLQDPYDDEEETLSLSDLPIYSGAHSTSSAQWGHDNFNKEDGKNSQNDEDDDDFFEFFSEEFTTSTSSASADNIIFCGKLIPIFKDLPPDHDKGKKLESKNTIQKGSSALLPSYEEHFNKKGPQEAKSYTSEYSSSGKVSLVRSSTKSRWFLFMFGKSRLFSNTEMELRDIRSRQRRSQSRTGPVAMNMLPAPEHGGEEVEIKVRRRSYKGLWKVSRSISLGLGCKSSKLANDVVKAAFVGNGSSPTLERNRM